jgi:hypothetical protein
MAKARDGSCWRSLKTDQAILRDKLEATA